MGISSLVKVLAIFQDPTYAQLYIQFAIKFNDPETQEHSYRQTKFGNIHEIKNG